MTDASKESVVVVGAGICGLCTGLALVKAGHRVTLIERDAAATTRRPR